MRLTAEQRDLVERHVPLARSIARKLWMPPVDTLDDVESDAMWGLACAARMWDPRRGVPFDGYARAACAGKIKRGRQHRSGVARAAWEAGERARPLSLNTPAGDTGLELGDLVEHPGRDIDAATDAVAVTQALEQLSDREHEVIALRFWENWSQSRVAARIGYTQMHVSRIERAALGRLRETLAA